MELTEYEQKSLDKLCEAVINEKWSDDGLVQLIELAGGFLNLETVPDYSKANEISDRAARKDTAYRTNRTIFNTKYIIDNL